MRQHLTTLNGHLPRLREAAKQVAPFAFAAVMFFRFSPEGQTTLLWMWATLTALFVGWYIIAKWRFLRWMAASEQRAAESKARMEAYWEREEQRQSDLRAGQSDADWFNWDGPFTVAGQPR